MGKQTKESFSHPSQRLNVLGAAALIAAAIAACAKLDQNENPEDSPLQLVKPELVGKWSLVRNIKTNSQLYQCGIYTKTTKKGETRYKLGFFLTQGGAFDINLQGLAQDTFDLGNHDPNANFVIGNFANQFSIGVTPTMGHDSPSITIQDPSLNQPIINIPDITANLDKNAAFSFEVGLQGFNINNQVTISPETICSLFSKHLTKQP